MDTIFVSDVEKIRQLIAEIRDCLPNRVDPAGLGVKSKAPFQLLCAREALIWRFEELSRTACDALDREDYGAAAILTRASTETAGLVWRLMEILDARAKYSPQELTDLFMKAVVGVKNAEGLPSPFNVLDCIDRINKKIPHVRTTYDGLSEIAHPNWRGSIGLYSRHDRNTLITHFGRGLRSDPVKGQVTSALAGSLAIFKYSYNRISETMPTFISELEPLNSADDEKPTT